MMVSAIFSVGFALIVCLGVCGEVLDRRLREIRDELRKMNKEKP
jgi:hypothetical protein